MLEVLKKGEVLPLLDAQPLAEKEDEPVNDVVTELLGVTAGLKEGRAEGLLVKQAVELLDGVELEHGEGEDDCVTLGELVEYLLRDPSKDSEALADEKALLLPQALAVADTQAEALSVGEAVEQMVGVALAEGLGDGVVRALSDAVGVGGGITDAVPQLLTEVLCTADKEGDVDTLLLTVEPGEGLPKGDDEARSVSVDELVAQGELDGDCELAAEAV